MSMIPMKQSNGIKLLVGTPAYGCLLHIDYCNSLTSYFYKEGLNITTMFIGNESLITRARNEIFSYFANNTNNFDYLLFLDADILFPYSELVKLLNAQKDIIGAPVRLKDFTRQALNIGNILDSSNYPIVKVTGSGSSVLLISSHAALKIKEWAIKTNNIYHTNPDYIRKDSATNVPVQDVYNVFQVGVIDGNYYSEDYWFCNLASSLGISTFVHMEAFNGHNGNMKLIYSEPPTDFNSPKKTSNRKFTPPRVKH